jgi:hypothetical protein
MALLNLEHRTLRVLPDVKVRLGEMVLRSGRVQQKGVDSYLQRDLTTLARNKAVADVVLLGGDKDLRRALEEAQDHGTRAHLWGVEAAAPEYNQSQSLIAEADRRWVIPAEWIKRYVRLRVSDAEQHDRRGGQPVQRGVASDEATRMPRLAPEVVSEREVATSDLVSGRVTLSGPSASAEDLERLVATFKKGSGREVDEGRGWTVTELLTMTSPGCET